jgi:hypothetical protein
MAILSKTGITTGTTVETWHVTQSVDAFTGTEAYDITISGSLTVTGSVDITDTINIGNAGFINGLPILTSAAITGTVTSVNGVYPINGNVTTALTAVITGDSASLIISSSGAATGSINEGTVWVIAGDPNPNNNGDSYIFAAGPPGVWYPIAPLDQAAADSRYILKNGDDSHTGSLYISGSNISIDLLGNTRINVVNDLANNVSINPNNRELYDASGNITLNWDTNGFFYGTSSWATDALDAVTASYAPNFANTNLTSSGNRTHNTNGNFLWLQTSGSTNGATVYLDSTNWADMGWLNPANYTRWTPTNIQFYLNNISRIHITGSETVINDSSNDVDFRVEGDTDANLFFIDASVDRVGIGKNTPSAKLDVNGNTLITGSLTTTSTISSPSTPTVGVLNNTSDASLIVNADSYGIARWVANFTATRNLVITNLSEGQSVKVYVRNGNGTARTISIQASSGVLLPTSVVCSRGGSAGASFVSLNGAGGTATIWVSNVGGLFIGAIY